MSRTITFQPSEKMGEFIEGLVKSGDYNNQSEVIRAGVRLLEEQTASSKLQQLRQLIQAGDDSGISDNNVLDVMQRVEKRLKKNGKL